MFGIRLEGATGRGLNPPIPINFHSFTAVHRMKRANPKLRDPVTRALKADFDAAHEAGKRALKDRDFEGVAQAVERERQVIEQQRARLTKHKAAMPRRLKR